MNCKFDEFDRAKVGYDKMAAYDKELWNAAIEAAAEKCDNLRRKDYSSESDDWIAGTDDCADEIRKLKK